MKKFISILLSAVILVGVSGCQTPETEKTNRESSTEGAIKTDGTEKLINSEVDEMGTYKALNAEKVKLIGRTWLKDDVLWCAYSGAGVEFTFKGKSAAIKVVGDNAASNTSDNCVRIGIYADGKRIVDDMLSEKDRVYDIAGDEGKDVTVRIIKLSESAMSTFGIESITVDGGEIAPTANKDMLVEFIGDSITCGYGVDDEVKENHFKTSTEDVTRAYAYNVAKLLDADYSMVSFSGYGIISGYTSDKKISEQTVLQYYDKVGFSYNNPDAAATQWDFNRLPDIVVINLGTNDDSYCQGKADREQEYKDAYIEFIKSVRSKNPNAEIYCTLGIMGDRLFSSIETAVSEYTAETGDSNIKTFKFDVQVQADGYAADWHPTGITHYKAANKLAEFIDVDYIIKGLDPSKPMVALTFDDGPNNTTTNDVLDVLEKYGVTGSFFLIGNNVGSKTVDVMRRTLMMGCEINNHSKTHSYMNKMTKEDIIDEITSTSDKIAKITGAQPKFFRPPYIAVNDTMYEAIDLPFICGIGCEDYLDTVTAEQRIEKMLKAAKDGIIYLLHDSEGNSKTVEAIDTVIPKLLEEGYQFVTVSQLFKLKGVTPTTANKEIYSYVN